MEKNITKGTTSGQRRIRYDSVYLTYSKKLTGSQLSLPHGKKRRPRTRWQDNITKWIGLTGDRLPRSVEDRS